ncbi:hypothetical protein ACJJTC_017739 [Scirpophaga incertulas]
MKKGVFTGPGIKKLLSDHFLPESMTEIEKEAWDSFKYKTIVQHMLTAYKAQVCKMRLKVHFIHSHIEYFPENLGAYTEEQGERFHQNVRDIEKKDATKEDGMSVC